MCSYQDIFKTRERKQAELGGNMNIFLFKVFRFTIFYNKQPQRTNFLK